jgi:hypothetical protein
MFHRDHVTRFLTALDLKPEDAAAIESRTEAAIAQFGDNEGHFSGGRIAEVLGNAELAEKFNEMWESGKLHPPR